MRRIVFVALAVCAWFGAQAARESVPEDVAVWITIGQSNADGSAYADSAIDAEMEKWYDSESNPGKMRIWYRSSKIVNQTDAPVDKAARWVFDDSVDAPAGWMDLWYRNENNKGRTAMNMIHSYGTRSVGGERWTAQGRRGMEGEFGRKFSEAFPDRELYVIKLGASGSSIASWADPRDNHNWNYFFDNIYRPAIDSLLASGKRPRLAGIWWMQGCGDAGREKAYYEKQLTRLVDKLRGQTGFEKAKIYVGRIVEPGQSVNSSTASTQFGRGVREAQYAVARSLPDVEIIVTDDCPFQDDNLHFNHEGVNRIGDKLAAKAILNEPVWAQFSTPGEWNRLDTGNPQFVPLVGNPVITYSIDGDVVTATLDYGTWKEIKTARKTR